MLALIEQITAGPISVQELERRTRNTVEWICQTFWQYASPARQEKYPQYALSSGEYGIKSMQRSGDVTNYIPDEEAIELCNNNLIWLSFPDLEGRDPTAREAGMLLERLSQCHCMFGAPASLGDFESYMWYRATRYASGDWESLTDIDFVAAWERYQRDEQRDINLYLMQMLSQGYEVLADIAKARGLRITDLCSFRYNHVDGGYELDEEFFSSGIHILSAMAAFLTPPGKN